MSETTTTTNPALKLWEVTVTVELPNPAIRPAFSGGVEVISATFTAEVRLHVGAFDRFGAREVATNEIKWRLNGADANLRGFTIRRSE